MSESKSEEEERRREAIRLAEKWKRIEAPLAVTAVFLSIIAGLILYVFHLPLTVIIIIIMAMIFVTTIPVAFYYGNKISKLTGYDKLRFIKRIELHPEEKNVLKRKILKLSLFIMGCVLFILSPLSIGIGSFFLSLAGLVLILISIPEMGEVARLANEMNVRMLSRDDRRLARECFNIISLEKVCTFSWERKIKRKIIMEKVSASSVGTKASLILNSDNGKRYSTLQEAVNDPETKDGHTLIVEPGIHIGGVIVNKSLTIKSSSSRPEETVVTTEWADEDVFTVFADNVKISGFTIRGGFNGILLDGVKNCVVSKNIIFGNRHAGIQLSDSVNNIISENLIHGNTGDFGQGIRLYESSGNIIMMNNIIKNRYGILIGSSDNNTLYLNNFNNVKKNVSSHNSKNNWNSPVEIEYVREGRLLRKPLGNYWSDHSGKDVDGDGVGDTPHSIRGDGNDEDRYPLLEPFEKYVSKEAELLRQLNTNNVATNI